MECIQKYNTICCRLFSVVLKCHNFHNKTYKVWFNNELTLKMLYFKILCCYSFFFLGEIFTYAIVLYVFRASIRRNTAEAIFAVRLKFFPLLFGMNKKLPENRNLKPALETNASKEIQDNF